MSKDILNKYTSLVVMNNEVLAKQMLKEVTEMPQLSVEQRLSISFDGGDIIMHRNDEPEAVLEMVMGHIKDDCSLTLYAPHPALSSREALTRARIEVIGAIEKKRGVSGQYSSMIRDRGRDRSAFLHELGLAQLVDVLRFLEA
jgi:hypothetical protein